MTRRIIFLSVVCGLLATGGCRAVQKVLYSPLGPGTMCSMEHCSDCDAIPSDAGCGGCGVCDDCAPVDRDSSCDSACGECGGCRDACGCGGPCCCCRVFGWIGELLDPEAWCGGSCGEIYWGDFHGDPPDCRDPCDGCGNFTGVNIPGRTGGCVDGGCSDGGFDGFTETPVRSGPMHGSGCNCAARSSSSQNLQVVSDEVRTVPTRSVATKRSVPVRSRSSRTVPARAVASRGAFQR